MLFKQINKAKISNIYIVIKLVYEFMAIYTYCTFQLVISNVFFSNWVYTLQ